MASANEAGVDLRESVPLSRNILHTCERNAYGYTGQRTDLKIHDRSRGHRGWSAIVPVQKVSAGHLHYPVDVRDSAKSGLGQAYNRHLNYLVESISVNVGGSHQNVKASSLPMSGESVGGSIVVRGWESQPHGEGSQFVGYPMQMVTECQHEGGSSCECR